MPALLSSDLSCIIIWSFPPRSLPSCLCVHPRSAYFCRSVLPPKLSAGTVLLTRWSPAPHPCSECRKGSVDARGKGACPHWWSRCSCLPASLCSGLYTTLRHLFLKHISDHLIAWWRHFQGVPSSYSIQFTPLIKPSPTQDLAEFPNSFLPISFILAV